MMSFINKIVAIIESMLAILVPTAPQPVEILPTPSIIDVVQASKSPLIWVVVPTQKASPSPSPLRPGKSPDIQEIVGRLTELKREIEAFTPIPTPIQIPSPSPMPSASPSPKAPIPPKVSVRLVGNNNAIKFTLSGGDEGVYLTKVVFDLTFPDGIASNSNVDNMKSYFLRVHGVGTANDYQPYQFTGEWSGDKRLFIPSQTNYEVPIEIYPKQNISISNLKFEVVTEKSKTIIAW